MELLLQEVPSEPRVHLSQLLLNLTSVVIRIVVERVGVISDVVHITTSHVKIVDDLVDLVRSLAFEHLLVHLFWATLTVLVILLLVDLDLILIFDVQAAVLVR